MRTTVGQRRLILTIRRVRASWTTRRTSRSGPELVHRTRTRRLIPPMVSPTANTTQRHGRRSPAPHLAGSTAASCATGLVSPNRLGHRAARYRFRRRLNEQITSTRREDELYPWISWHESTAVDPDRAPGGQGVVRLHVLDAPLHPTGDAADLNAGTTPRGTTRYPRHSPGVPSRCAADTPPRYRTCIRSVLPAGGADGRRLVGLGRRSRLSEPNLPTRRLAVERVPGERGVSGAAGAVAQR